MPSWAYHATKAPELRVFLLFAPFEQYTIQLPQHTQVEILRYPIPILKMS